MKRTQLMVVMVALVMALTVGCAGTHTMSSPQVQTEPLQLRYDIQYVDNTAIGVEVMVMSPELPWKSVQIQHSMDRAFDRVARQIPKSAILGQQGEFQSVLKATFKDETGHDTEASLFVLNVVESDWDEPTTMSMK